MAFKLYDEDFKRVEGYASKRDYRRAIDYLGGVGSRYKHANDSKRAAYHYYLALCNSKLGDYTAADTHFNIAIADLSGRHQIAIERATSYLQRGSLKEANETLKELGQNRGIEDASLYRLFCKIKARYHLLSGEYQSALEIALKGESIDRHPEPAPIKETIKARRYIRNGADPLVGSLEYAVGLLTIDLDAKNNQQSKNTQQNSHILSYIFLENLMKGLKEPEDKVECYIALSRFATELDDIKRAKIFIDRAITLSPENAELRAERIKLSCQNGEADEALRLYNQDKDLIRTYPTATREVLETFNTASVTPTFKSLTHSFSTIAASLAKHLSKQRDACPNAWAPN